MPQIRDAERGRSTEPKKERFLSTKKMINDEEGMGRILKHSGMFIILIVWNVLEAFTRFIPSAIWIFIVSGLLDALINCMVIIFAAKLKDRNVWIWAAIISGWNILTLLSYMLPINLWILIDIILDVIINILFLIFAPMVFFDERTMPSQTVELAPGKLVESNHQPTSVKTAAHTLRPGGAVVRPPETPKETSAETNLQTGFVSENALENDTLKMAANLALTNRILAEQLQKQGGVDNDKLDSENGGG